MEKNVKRKIILLSGVHGVGKGYYLKNYIRPSGKFEILEASKLISKYKKADDAGYKKVKNVSDNQQVLLRALEEEKRKLRSDIILDGHLCVLNNEGNIECIPDSFIIEASITNIVLLQDEVENIVRKQTERDGLSMPIELVKAVQKAELKQCRILANKYELPYNVINMECSFQQFCKIVNIM